MKLHVVFLSLLALACTNNQEPKIEKITITDFTCADQSLCSDLRDSEDKCRGTKEPASCAKFVEVFEKLAVKNDCQRKFDTQPVPSVWVCDEDAAETSHPKLFERSADTLSKIDLPAAKKFYGSEAFRSVLDGAVAEAHLKKSQEMGKTK